MIFPKGFRATGIHCGIKKKNAPDLAVFYSNKPSAAAGIFTKNIFRAAPVIVSEEMLSDGKTAGNIRAIIANSGCANASTGAHGISDVKKIRRAAQNFFGIKNGGILNASTGVIGQFLPIENILNGIKILSDRILVKNENDPIAAAKAIMTTDTFHKISSARFSIGGKTITIWACAKGSGMIAPDMATMLSFILTDAKISPAALKKALVEAADVSYNRLTVDGDTSTNDTVFILANGEAQNPAITGGRDLKIFTKKLKEVTTKLAQMLASDGEGATKLIIVNVSGARNADDARRAAKAVAESPLVKTAIYGRDANWGRITATLGRCGAAVNPSKTDVSFGNLKVFSKGRPADFSEAEALKILSAEKVEININLGLGKSGTRYYTCDFSEGYIRINAAYRT